MTNSLIKKNVKAIELESPEYETALASDYKYARDLLYDMAEKGRESVIEMQNIAEKTEETRDYEALASLIKTTLAAADKIMNNQKSIVSIIKTKEADSPGSSNSVELKGGNNVVYVGTTTDLQRSILEESDIIDAEEFEEE